MRRTRTMQRKSTRRRSAGAPTERTMAASGPRGSSHLPRCRGGHAASRAPEALTFAATATYFIAALGAFLLLRAIGLRELPALFGAGAWAFATYVVSFPHPAHGNAVALLPLVLLGARRIAQQPGARATALLAAGLILLVLCGHPESALHVVALAAVYVVVSLQAGLRRVAAAGLAAGAITLILTAFFVAPMLDALPQTREYLHRAADGAELHGAPWRVVAHVMETSLVPFLDGINGVEEAHHGDDLQHAPAGSAYAGALLFAPALLAVWRVRSRDARFFAAVTLFGLLRGVASQRFAAAGLVALLLIQRVFEAGALVPTVDRRAFQPPIAGLRVVAGGDAPYRVVAESSLFAPNIAARYGLEDVRG